jgi:superfamily II DNA or RNA helicase
MAQDLEALFQAIRQACFPATWSRGVELTRADAVVGDEQSDDEAVFRVTTRGGMLCPTVTLYPDDRDWDCDCASREDVCEHVAAAVIAWRRSADAGDDLPRPKHAAGRVGYRFTRDEGRLALQRVIVHEEVEQLLEATLVAVSEGRVAGPRFLATQADLAVELALGTHRRGPLPPQLLRPLFVRLIRCGDIRLDGRPVAISTEPLLPLARVRERGDGFLLTVEPDSSVTERFTNGAVLCGDTLRVRGDPKLTARERADFEHGRYFDTNSVAELVTELLPDLARRIRVHVETERLPQTVDERPRSVLDTRRTGETLSVLPTLVYGDPPVARIDGGRLVHLSGPVPLRDEAAERLELRRLAQLGMTPGVRSEFEGAEAVALVSRLESWSGTIRGSGRREFRLGAPLEPGLETDAGAFAVTFRSEMPHAGKAGTASRNADPGAVLQAWRAGKSLVPLMGGGWAALPVDWLDRFGAHVADLLAAREPDGKIPGCCLNDLALLCEELDEPPPTDLHGLRRLAQDFEGLPRVPLPADLATPPRPYQQQGVDWLVFLREAGMGAMLADDMGLGKTLQALCALRPPALVVAPTSVLHNWAAELRTHRPGLSFSLYHGSQRKLDPDVDVTLTTYAILRLDADRLASRRWGTVVLDEAQRIKNPDSQVAAAAFGLVADFRVTLSGTPVENRLDELWSQFHFINRGLLGGRKHFQVTYSDPIASGDLEVAARLHERLRPFILRRLKREVATELPPRTEIVLRCELSEPEREIYDTIRAATLKEVVKKLDAGGGGVMAALEALLRLRQAACHGSLIPGRTLESSAKLRLLTETLDTVVADGHKALVFSQWTSLLDLVEPCLQQANVRYVRLDGTTRDRGEVVRRFQEQDEISLMLISLKAGGTGLNLTAADHIFLLDPWWNPAVEDQAADRAHRIGQTRPVMIHRLVAIDTVEERILDLQQAKRELAELALHGTGKAAGLTKDDLLGLLR